MIYTPDNIIKVPLLENYKVACYSNLTRGAYIKFSRLGLGKKRLHFFYMTSVIYLYFNKLNLFLVSINCIKGFLRSIMILFLTFFIPINQGLLLKGYGLEFFTYSKSWLALRIHRKSRKGVHFIRIPKTIKIQFIETSEILRKTQVNIYSLNVDILGWFLKSIKHLRRPGIYTGTGIFFLSEYFSKRVGKSANFS